jgi:uncharacterized protein YecT (DUF1311 family)
MEQVTTLIAEFQQKKGNGEALTDEQEKWLQYAENTCVVPGDHSRGGLR